jgi:hypothetical protein
MTTQATPATGKPTDDTELIEAVGKLTEGFEWLERARGRLYDFHQMIGHADFLFGDAADAFRACGRDDLADALDRDLVGRNVLDGRWTFQIIEEFDGGYYEQARRSTTAGWDMLGGQRHAYEAQLKQRRRSPGRPGHELEPPRPSA